jgi:diadenosine tetraphosphate (Ap4A) HIT family hydrolase
MAWWSEEVWTQMQRGVDCSICASASRSNEHSDLIEETEHSYIHLKKNRAHPGHCCVIFKRHAPELHDLTPQELRGFTTDLARLGRVLAKVFEPVKLDQLIMGHLCPHSSNST